MGVNDLSKEESGRLYGPWSRRTPTDVATLMYGYSGVWWVAGGWALEAFTGVAREHEDTDASVLRADLPMLRKHLAGQLDVWTAADGALRPLLPEDDPNGVPDDVLPQGADRYGPDPRQCNRGSSTSCSFLARQSGGCASETSL